MGQHTWLETASQSGHERGAPSTLHLGGMDSSSAHDTCHVHEVMDTDMSVTKSCVSHEPLPGDLRTSRLCQSLSDELSDEQVH